MTVSFTTSGLVQPSLDLAVNDERQSFQSAEQLVDDTIKEQIAHIERQPCTVGFDDSFFVADVGEICRQHDRWVSHLPDIMPFYAVKCNPDRVLLHTLVQLRVGFDCASVEEMRTVLSLGASPSNIIFANPCKPAWALDFANRAGIEKTVFDNLDELDTIKKHMPNAELLLRIYANDTSALIAFGDKFGAPLESTKGLLVRAKELGLNVVGVSFHIGTGASDPNAYRKAIAHSRIVWNTAQSLGFSPRILDIGGGFHPEEEAFGPMASAVSKAIYEASFPEQTIFITEPGRFFARTVFTLVCRIISRRVSNNASPNELGMLYQNDGVFGHFVNSIFEGEIFAPALIKSRDNDGRPRKATHHAYKIWGPTCDSSDCVTRRASFSCEVKINDWLVYRDMGAYTLTTATEFNGFLNKACTVYVNSDQQPT
ncbi:Ornithine decarboxylase [Cladobotryum mycophilum]|uniref:Ornithine decarboxylase n=1 Tax=Cladobotryum mycophilum TaxID=491253 RepID=A0ABR0T2F2_9HYPO